MWLIKCSRDCEYIGSKHSYIHVWAQKLRIRFMCASGLTCLSVDCCFSELTLLQSIKHVGLVQSEPHFIENKI